MSLLKKIVPQINLFQENRLVFSDGEKNTETATQKTNSEKYKKISYRIQELPQNYVINEPTKMLTDAINNKNYKLSIKNNKKIQITTEELTSFRNAADLLVFLDGLTPEVLQTITSETIASLTEKVNNNALANHDVTIIINALKYKDASTKKTQVRIKAMKSLTSIRSTLPTPLVHPATPSPTATPAPSPNNTENKYFSSEKTDRQGNKYYEYQGTKTEDPSLGKIFATNKNRNTLWIVKDYVKDSPKYVKIERRGTEYFAAGTGKIAYEKKYGTGRIVIPKAGKGKAAVRVYLQEPEIQISTPKITETSLPTEKTFEQTKNEWQTAATNKETAAAKKTVENITVAEQKTQKPLDSSISKLTDAGWDKNHFNIEGLNHAVNILNQSPFTLRSYQGLQKFLRGKTTVSINDLDKAFNKNYDPKKATDKNTLANLKEARDAIVNLRLAETKTVTSYDLLHEKIADRNGKHTVDFKTDFPYDLEDLRGSLPKGTQMPDEFRKFGLVVTGKARKQIKENFPPSAKGITEKRVTALLLQLYKPAELANAKNNNNYCLKTSNDGRKSLVLDNLPADFIENATPIITALENANDKNFKDTLYKLIIKFGTPERKLEAHAAHMVDPEHTGSKEFNKDKRLNWANILEGSKAEYTNQFQTVTAERAAYLRILQRVQHIDNPIEKANAFKNQLNEFIRQGIDYLYATLPQEQKDNLYKRWQITDINKPLEKADPKKGHPYGHRDFLRVGYMVDNNIREAKQRIKATTEVDTSYTGLPSIEAQIEGILKARGLELKPEAKKQIVEALWHKVSVGVGAQAVIGGGIGAGFGMSFPVQTSIGQTFNVYATFKVDSAKGVSADAGMATTFNLGHIDLTISAGLIQRSVGVTAKLPDSVNLSIGLHELGGGAAFGVSATVGFRMEDIVESQKVAQLKKLGLNEIHWLMAKNPPADFTAKAYKEIMAHSTLGKVAKEYIDKAETAVKKAENRSLTEAEKVKIAWRAASLQLAAEKAQQNPTLKEYINRETAKLEQEFKAKGLTLDETAKQAFALKLSQAYIDLKANETTASAKLPPVTGVGIVFITPPGLPIPYVGIVTGRKTVVMPFVSSDIDQTNLTAQIHQQLSQQKNVTYEVTKAINLGKTQNMTREVLSGRLKLADKNQLTGYNSLQEGTIFDSTKAYNEKLKSLGVQLQEQTKYKGLLELKVKNPGERLTLHIDNDMQDKVRIVYHGTKAYLAIKAGTPLFINREDLSYSFKKDGAFTHTELTIKSNPYIKNSLIRNNPQGFYLSRRTRVVNKTQGYHGEYLSGTIMQEKWSERAYRGKAAQGNAAIMQLNEYNVENKNDAPAYQAEKLSFANYNDAAKRLHAAIVSKETTSTIDRQREAVLINIADQFANTGEYKRMSTIPFSSSRKQKNVELNLGKLTRSINGFAKDLNETQLNQKEIQFILMRLMHKSFMNLQGITNKAEREAKFKNTFDTFTKPLVTYIFKQKMEEMGYPANMANILTNKLVENVMKNGLDLAAKGEIIPQGTLFASLVGTKNTDGRYVTGLRVSENFGQQSGEKKNSVGKNALILLNKTEFHLNKGSNNEKAIARVLLETLSPVPKEDFKLIQSPLALKLAPFIGFSFGPEGMKALATIFAAKDANNLKTILANNGNQQIFTQFKNYVQEARNRQIAGGDQAQNWQLAVPGVTGAVLQIDLSKVNVAAGLYKRCGNLSFVANEEISAKLTLNRRMYAGGVRKNYETNVRAKLAIELKSLGIAVMIGDMRKPEPRPEPRPVPVAPKRAPDTIQKPDIKVPDKSGPRIDPQPKDKSTPPPASQIS